MSVLVALSVGSGYLFSVAATFLFKGEGFYEAAAVLLTFVLFGLWLAPARACICSSWPWLVDPEPDVGHLFGHPRLSDSPWSSPAQLRPPMASQGSSTR